MLNLIAADSPAWSTSLTAAIASIVSAVKSVWTSIFTNNTILPYFIIGISVSVVLVAIKVIKSVVWGS